MKSKFNKLLLSTVFAGLCFGCFTPSFAEGQRSEDKSPLEAPAPEKVGPRLPAPKLDEEVAPAAPAPAEEEKKFSKIGDIEKVDKDGIGYFFYCSYVGGRGATVRGAHGNWNLEASLKGACMACLGNGVKSCTFAGCTAKDYYTDRNGDKRFDSKSVEREVEIDVNSANLACPISVKDSRTNSKTGVNVGDEVGKKGSIASLVPSNPNTEGSANGGSFHYESGSSFESNSNGYYREKEYKYDSRRGGASREIVIPPRPRFWGNDGGFFGPPPAFGNPGGAPAPKGKPEVIPHGKGRPEIDRRNPEGEGRPQPQNERREESSERDQPTRI